MQVQCSLVQILLQAPIYVEASAQKVQLCKRKEPTLLNICAVTKLCNEKDV